MDNIFLGIKTLNSIRGLYIPADITEKEAIDCSLLLDKFIDLIPVYADNLTRNLEQINSSESGGKNEVFFKCLDDFRDICRNIYADSLVYECGKLKEYVNNEKERMSQILLQNLITNMATLSIAIQVAQLNGYESDNLEESFLMFFEREIYKLQHNLQHFDAAKSMEIYKEINTKVIPIEIVEQLSELGECIKMYNFDDGITICKEMLNIILQSYMDVSKKKDGKYIILAVDDKPDILNTLRETIPQKDYKFYAVTSGEDCIKFLKTHKPDLCFLDIEMPVMDGYMLAEIIKKELKLDFPILFLTAHSEREKMQKAFSVGAVDFLVKPVSVENLLLKLREHIKRK